MTYSGNAVTSALLAKLTGAGLVVGDGVKPNDGGWQGAPGESAFVGYVVVHPLFASDIDGTLDDPSGDVWPIHQISAYGESRAQCETVADLARTALLSGAFVVAGRNTGPLIVEAFGGAIRFDDVQPPLWQSADRYRAFSTPS